MEMIGESKFPQVKRLAMLANLGFHAFTLLLQLHPGKFKFMGTLEQLSSQRSGRNAID